MASISRVQIPGEQVPGAFKGDSSKLTTGPSFKQVLESREASGESMGSFIKNTLEKLEGNWQKSFQDSRKLLSSVPQGYRPLFEAQVSVARVHFQTEIVSKIGDSVQGTVKRLQQQGS
jgi:hypothetical protein